MSSSEGAQRSIMFFFFLFAACWRWKLLIEAGEEWPDPAYL